MIQWFSVFNGPHNFGAETKNCSCLELELKAEIGAQVYMIMYFPIKVIQRNAMKNCYLDTLDHHRIHLESFTGGSSLVKSTIACMHSATKKRTTRKRSCSTFLYSHLLPQCEALHTCHSGFLIATSPSMNQWT